MRRIAKVDENQADIVQKLRGIGARVYDCHRFGGGFPDLLVSYRGVLVLIEVKNLKGKGSRLTDDEQVFYNEWQDHVFVATSPEEAIAVLERL